MNRECFAARSPLLQRARRVAYVSLRRPTRTPNILSIPFSQVYGRYVRLLGSWRDECGCARTDLIERWLFDTAAATT
ncbi:hypothetical protein [Nocardia africana]|uniref:hypothetical protein n=1 Tax=Nocardia africana TaxID=134964 RepID=UPI001C3F92D0|nr:hypothetical protein [Nocardia africana]MCC3313647.1 hypothetical protein [Nocardia africana]